MNYQNFTVLITGAGSGIGRSLASCFAERGANVVLVDRTQRELENCARECKEKYGDRLIHFVSDLTRVEDLQRLVGETVNRFGGIDVLINNAGVLDGNKRAQEANLAEWEYCMDVNLRAPMHLTRLALENMIQRRDPNRPKAIVFMTGGYAKESQARMAAYTATKHGLRGFAGSLFEDVRDHGIKVIQISPGYTATKMTEEVLSRTGGQRYDESRLLSPSDIARTICFAIEQPQNVCVTDIVIRGQLPHTPY
eukprot:tig00001126_g7123.t1